nr:hypothetical protein [Nioella ostreopsis]
MIGKHYIAGQWTGSDKSFLSAPVRGQAQEFSVGMPDLVEIACSAAEAAFETYARTTADARAEFLNTIADEIAKGWAASLTKGTGPFCTNPGVAVLPAGADASAFAEAVVKALSQGMKEGQSSPNGWVSQIGLPDFPVKALAETVPAGIGFDDLEPMGAVEGAGGDEAAIGFEPDPREALGAGMVKGGLHKVMAKALAAGGGVQQDEVEEGRAVAVRDGDGADPLAACFGDPEAF